MAPKLLPSSFNGYETRGSPAGGGRGLQSPAWVGFPLQTQPLSLWDTHHLLLGSSRQDLAMSPRGLLHGFGFAPWGIKPPRTWPGPAALSGRSIAPAAVAGPAPGSRQEHQPPRGWRAGVGIDVSTHTYAQPCRSITPCHMWLSAVENRCSVLSNPYGNRLVSLCCRINHGRRSKARESDPARVAGSANEPILAQNLVTA